MSINLLQITLNTTDDRAVNIKLSLNLPKPPKIKDKAYLFILMSDK